MKNRVLLVISFLLFGAACTSKQSTIPPPGASGSSSGPNLFSLDGKVYTKNDLPANIQNSMYEAEKRHQNNLNTIFHKYLVDSYIEELAKKEGKKADAIREKLLNTADPTEKEMKAFYDKNKDRIPYPYDQVKAQLKGFMQQEEGFKKQNALVDKAKTFFKYQSLLTLDKPKPIEIDYAKFPSKGNDKADTVLVEFADYQCAHCAHFYAEFKTLFEKYKNKIKFVFIDFPINGSGISTKVAEGAFCANKQGKFWEYHGMAFENQQSLTATSPVEFAQKLGLDTKAFSDCFISKEAKEHVASGKKEGEKAGITGTPTLFINGQKVEGGEHGIADALKNALGS